MIVLDHNSSPTSARDMKNVVVKMNSGVGHRLYFSNITNPHTYLSRIGNYYCN